MSQANVKLLALCGSLRQSSLNAMALRVMSQHAPVGVMLSVYPTLAHLPLFNPDLEAQDPLPVRALREALLTAQGVIIASPEYAHGISGVLKNALDWMVGTEAFVAKPVLLVNTSPRATHAQAALREVLATMSAQVLPATLELPLLGSGLNEAALSDTQWVSRIQAALTELRAACLTGC